MIYNEFQGKQLSMLGFGAMRLPLAADGSVDEAQTEEMIRYGIEHGVNYFDTAYPYHAGHSELIMGRILRQYPREKYYLATKFPGHQISDHYDPKTVFENQLKKCGVEYFDFYLLHNVYENSIGTYTDERWGILEYFREQKRLGRIRHLGFSTHGGIEVIREFLDLCDGDMEFCQIQLNYLDWTLQNAKAKYDLLTERKVPVWVMEPVRGGRLATLSDGYAAVLNAVYPERTPAEWALRFFQGMDNVKVVLSGMSDMAQMRENVDTFARREALKPEEIQALMTIAEGLKDSIPCTGCRYCCSGCPQGLNIPMLIGVYNELRYASSTNTALRMDALPLDKRPEACVRCGKCTMACPQGIDVPKALQGLLDELKKVPSWAEASRQREEEQRMLEGKY